MKRKTKHCLAVILTLICGQHAFSQCKERSVDSSDWKNKTVVVSCNRDLQKGQVIRYEFLSRSFVEPRNRPPDAIYDSFIAVERTTLHSLKKGQPIRFRDCFSHSELQLSNKIEHLQGRFSFEKVGSNADNDSKIPTLSCRHDIKRGAIVGLTDINLGQVDSKSAPAQGVADIWVILGRQAICSMKAGHSIEYRDVIPHWMRLFYGRDAR